MESTHSLHQVPVQVSNVSVSIPLSQSILEILSRKPPQERTVLSDISFNASPGQLIAIMGASGSGKTTLLHALAGCHNGKVLGNIAFSGKSPLEFYENGSVGYVQQHDYLMPYLTVRETLQYCAELKLSSSISRREKLELVEQVILELGLKECADTLIGDDWRRGISGGEKRRVSVACQLLLNPSLLFMDEPTTGLDSFTSNNLIEILVRLSRKGRTVFVSIHQPRSDIFRLFDSVLLLSQGKVVYAGQGGTTILSYFEKIGYPCPIAMNPADFLIDLTSIDYRDDVSESETQNRVTLLIDAWSKVNPSDYAFSNDAKTSTMQIEADRADNAPNTKQVLKSPSPNKTFALVPLTGRRRRFGATFFDQVGILIRRGWVNMTRDNLFLFGYFFECIVVSTVMGWIFFGSEDGIQSIQTKKSGLYTAVAMQAYLMTIFMVYKTVYDMRIFDRDRQDRMFDVGPYLISQFIVQLPSNIIFPAIYSIIMYFMLGFRRDNLAVLLPSYIANMALSQMNVFAMCQAAVSIARGFAEASMTANVYFTFISMSTGYFVQLDSIPVYLKWFVPIAFTNFHFRWASSNEFTNNSYNCGTAPASACDGNNILISLGLKQNDNVVPPFALVISFLCYYFIAFILLKLIQPDMNKHAQPLSSKQKRDLNTIFPDEEVKEKITKAIYKAELVLKDISLNLQTKALLLSTSSTKTLLDQVNVKFKPGSLTIVMGGSGTGKTTLLSLLTGRKLRVGALQNVQKSGNILLNGNETLSLASYCSFVPQSDEYLLPALTCRETLQYSAQLRLPSTMSRREKTERADQVMRILGLRHVAHTIVGNETVKGLSGGEKRRLSIGVQMLTDPHVLVIDEPTSGLDAFTALYLMQTLKQLAAEGRTIICSVHQPRSDIFSMFDDLILLTRGGRVAYSGQASSIASYLEQCGHVLPPHTNPADFILDISSIDLRNEESEKNTAVVVNSLVENWRKVESQRSNSSSNETQDISSDTNAMIQTPLVVERKRSPFHIAYPTLVSRSVRNALRQPAIVISRVMQLVAMGIVISLYYVNQDLSQTSVQNRLGVLQQTLSALFIGLINCVSIFPAERNTFFYEYSDYAYSVEPFFFSYLTIEIPIELISSFLYAVIVIFVNRLTGNVMSYFSMVAAVFVIVNVGESIGIAFASIVHHVGFSVSITNAVLGIINVMSGLLSATLPTFLDRLSRLTPVPYTARLMAINEFIRDVQYTCTSTEVTEGRCWYRNGEDVLKAITSPFPGAFEFQYDQIGFYLGVSLALAATYRIISYIILRLRMRYI